MKKQQLVILHGWSLESDPIERWQPFLSALEYLQVQPVFLRLPGFGEYQLAEPWSLDMYVAWVEQQLPTKQTAILLGHSFGGQIAIRLAAKQTNQIDGLVLLGASGIRSQTWTARLKRRTWKTVASIGKAVTKSERARHVLYAVIGEKDYLRSTPVMRQTMTNVLSVDTQDDAARITVPTLLVWGEQDATTPVWIAERYHRLISGSTLELIAGARHAPHVTHTDSTSLLVAEFCDKVVAHRTR